jgi:error-prone DNA polymerase
VPTGGDRASVRSAVRLGLGYVLGVRADEAAALVAARAATGPFRTLEDLAARAGAGAPALAQIAWSGACDGLARNRRDALWRLGVAAPPHRLRAGTQLALPLALPEAPALRPLDDWGAMIADYATTGVTVDRHPLRLLRGGLQARGLVSSTGLDEVAHDREITIAGLVVARQRPGTAKGVCFLLLEDELGTVNLIVPPKVYERDRLIVRTEPLVVAQGKLERFASAGGAVNVLVRRLVALDAGGMLAQRPAAQVKDFSPLDARELARWQSDQLRVAAAVAGGATAAHVRPAATVAEPAPEGGGAGAEDFRAVAPPVMSFAQGRRR